MCEINENTLTFTTTAMPRPEIIDKTYSSFSKNLLDFDFKKATLIINIDSSPDKRKDHKRQEVVDVAKKHFGNVIVNMPETPNFSAAVKWCFSKVETDYCFHLEDDWELLIPFKVSFFNDFFVPPHVQQLAFRAWKNAKTPFWLSPSFLRGTFCRDISEKMNTVDNPEIHIRTLCGGYKPEGFIYFPFEQTSVILKDIGRSWMKKNGFNRGSCNFTKWSIAEKSKGFRKIADQNGQIPKEMLPTNRNKKRKR